LAFLRYHGISFQLHINWINYFNQMERSLKKRSCQFFWNPIFLPSFYNFWPTALWLNHSAWRKRESWLKRWRTSLRHR
jgi:hypothetical protein